MKGWKLLLAACSVALICGLAAACGKDNHSGSDYEFCTVTLEYTEAGTEKTETHLVVKGQPFAEPVAPAAPADCAFEGWLKGEELYDFSAPVMQDITLRASFERIYTTYLVHGIVRDELGNPVVGAEVLYGEKSVTTNRRGEYGMDTVIQRIEISKDGYYPVIIRRASSTAGGEYAVTLVERGQSSVIRSAEKGELTVDLNGSVRAKLLRGEKALRVRYEVLDEQLTAEAIIDQTDAVTRSDSVEFYLDTLGDGGARPQTDDWQINVTVNGLHRFVRGTGTRWEDAPLAADYIVTAYGDVNEPAAQSYGYTVDILFPYETFGLAADSDICFAVGQSGYGTTDPASTWNGWTYRSVYVDPQKPAKYQRWTTDGIETITGKDFTIDEKYVEGLAKLSADRLVEAKLGASLWEDDVTHMLWKGLPENMLGTSFVFGDSEHAAFTVETAGYVLLFAPAVGYGGVNAQIEEDGWERLVENGSPLGRDILYKTYTEPVNVYVKHCEAGESYDYGVTSIAFGAGGESEYYVMPWARTPATVHRASEYREPTRLWQGIPHILVLPNGAMLSAYFTGNIGEPAQGNYIVIDYSEGEGKPFRTLFCIVHDDPNVRCCDPTIFLNSEGVLFIKWIQTSSYNDAYFPNWMVHIDNPTDAPENWTVSDASHILDGSTCNRPLILSNGTMLMGAQLWTDADYHYVYASEDDGYTWTLRSRAYLGNEVATFAHESNFVELEGGKIWLFCRATAVNAGYYDCYSSDGGYNWTQAKPSVIPGAHSRGRLIKLRSGKILCLTNAETRFRGKMTAYLLTNDGTGPKIEGELLLDGRGGESYTGVSYPDAWELPDGRIIVVWDYDRRGAAEIVGTYLTEEKIKAGGTLPEEEKFFVSKLH